VLAPLGSWPEADLRLQLVRSVWLSLEQGHGRLQGQQALVGLTGRGAATSGRQEWLWLPDDQGQLRPVKHLISRVAEAHPRAIAGWLIGRGAIPARALQSPSCARQAAMKSFIPRLTPAD
jgi:hypothetical protein